MNKQEAIRLWKKATRHPEIKTLRRSRIPIHVICAFEKHHGVRGLVISATVVSGKSKRLITYHSAASFERRAERSRTRQPLVRCVRGADGRLRPARRNSRLTPAQVLRLF